MRPRNDVLWTLASLWTAVFWTLMALTSPGSGDIVTSSEKIKKLANLEGLLIDTLEKYVSEGTYFRKEHEHLEALSKFLSARSKAFYLSSAEEKRKIAQHPNGAYHLIKHFATTWTDLLERNTVLSSKFGSVLDSLPKTTDYQGALSAILRIQRVYKLQVSDIYIGNYMGYMGPALVPLDALEMGQQAFVEGLLEESIQWLELAADQLHRQEQQADATRSSRSSLVKALSLLGRAYLRMERIEDAKQKYWEGLALDPKANDVRLLFHEINMPALLKNYKSGNRSWHKNMSDLCLWNETAREAELRPYRVCRYKPSLYAPYVRYQEEILSVTPYVSIFYNFVSDSESDALKSFVREKMKRSQIHKGQEGDKSSVRTSDSSFIYDIYMELAPIISQRVKDVTWLEVDQRIPDGPSSSEAFQVVCYGLGGHYDAHMDPVNIVPSLKFLSKAGERIATFLTYLSDVERGGNTVFLRSGISVAPRKGMALFWYNFNPAMEEDNRTLHAGCPVVIGHKWIMTKWILTYGNTFRRPCGPHPHSTQLDIEPLMMSYVRRASRD